MTHFHHAFGSEVLWQFMTDSEGNEVQVAEDTATALASYEECSEEVFAALEECVKVEEALTLTYKKEIK